MAAGGKSVLGAFFLIPDEVCFKQTKVRGGFTEADPVEGPRHWRLF